MKAGKIKKAIVGILSAALLTLPVGVGFPAVSAQAASGSVYTAQLASVYRNPQTGIIEDAGGEQGASIADPMVSGIIMQNGLMEVTDSGEYYLTLRLSLMEYTSNHTFEVQNFGDTAWTPAAFGVTGNGTDLQGQTMDFVIQVPSESCVIRAGMYVEPMGRNVIWFIYPTGYSQGNQTDMAATMVTESGGGSDTYAGAGADGGGTAGVAAGLSSAAGGSDLIENNSENSFGESGASVSPEGGAAGKAAMAPDMDALRSKAAQLENSQSQDDMAKAGFSGAQGLSLSTAAAGGTADTDTEGVSPAGGASAAKLGAAITGSGLILIAAAAAVVYFFRKNWYSWGHGKVDDDDEDE